MVAILEHDPEPVSSARRVGTESAIPASARDAVPPLLDDIVARCLAKDPGQRWQTAADLEQALKWIADGSAETVRAPQRAARRGRLAWALAVGLLGAFSAIGMWRVTARASSTTGSVSRFVLSMPETDMLITSGLAVSPNGRTLVYVAQRSWHSAIVSPRAGSARRGAHRGHRGWGVPFFSPGGQWIGFFADNALKKVAAAGGTAVMICPAGFRRGASWGPDGMIVFASGSSPDLMQVAETGGTPKPLTTIAPQTGKRAEWPELTPDGRAVLYTVMATGAVDTARVVARSLDTGVERDVVAGTNPRLSPTGHLVFARPGELWAARFDRQRLAIAGAPMPVLDGVQVNSGGMALFALARDGSLVYSAPGRSVVMSVDRAGQSGGGARRAACVYGVPEPSPDGHRLVMAFSEQVASNPNIWTYDLERHLISRLTFGRSWDSRALWTPDAQRIVFSSDRGGGARNLFWTAADGSGIPEQFTRSPNGQNADSWTRDGRLLAFTENSTSPDIWTLQGNPARPPEPFLRTPYKESAAAFSPDGRWLAYQSNDAERIEIYVRPFPTGDGKVASINPRRRDPTLVARWEGTVLFSRRHADGGGHHTRPDFPGGCAAGTVQARSALELRWRFTVFRDARWRALPDVATGRCAVSNQVTLNWAEELTARVSTK